MRIKRSLQAAALIAAAVLLGLLTVQGSNALWNATVAAQPGTVTAASFDMKMTDTANAQTFTNMTLANGASATLAITPGGTLAPGKSVYGGVMVTNTTAAGGTFNTVITTSQATIANAGTGTLASHVTVMAKNTTDPADCGNPANYKSTAAIASPAVAKNASTYFCVQATLSATAPTSVKGQAVNITLPLTARQECGVPGGC